MKELNEELLSLKNTGEAPFWLTIEGYRTLKGGYLLKGETPKAMWRRVSNSASKYLNKPELAERFFQLFWKNRLCGSTPVLANMGTDRGLPISCNSIHVEDSIDSIFAKNKELAKLTKYGAGVGIYLGDIRPHGEKIEGGGKADGVIPWCKVYDTTISSVNQAGVRRGASAVYLPAEHGDILDFLRIRRPNNDAKNYCPFIHQAVVVEDSFMEKVLNKDQKARKIWSEILKTRLETGEPYLMFVDNANKANPEAYIKNNLKVSTSNICSEIFLHTDPEHSFVCCLSSLNLARWFEFEPDDIYYSIWFLDAVISEYLEKAKAKNSLDLEPAIQSALKGRAIGLGVLGWHTLLQEDKSAINSLRANILNRSIFKTIREEADRASRDLAKIYGEPEWCKGTGLRNTHRLAIAPTASNSIISGGVSAGIEPIIANAWAEKTTKATFIRKNPTLEKLLKDKNQDTPEVWTSIATKDGSVQHLDFLSEEEKEVFKTAYEIDQSLLIKQAGERQKYIDQGQSLNLFITPDIDGKHFNGLHVLAWRLGLKSLYYCRSGSVIKGDLASRENKLDSKGEVVSEGECKACEG